MGLHSELGSGHHIARTRISNFRATDPHRVASELLGGIFEMALEIPRRGYCCASARPAADSHGFLYPGCHGAAEPGRTMVRDDRRPRSYIYFWRIGFWFGSLLPAA